MQLRFEFRLDERYDSSRWKKLWKNENLKIEWIWRDKFWNENEKKGAWKKRVDRFDKEERGNV